MKRELSIEEKKRRRKRQRALALARKRRRKRFVIFLSILMAIFIGNNIHLPDKIRGIFTGNEDNANDFSAESDRKQSFLYEVKYEDFFEENLPQVFDDAEVYIRLKELAEEYRELKSIYKKRDAYPIKVLAALCNNPEMHEYVKGYLSYQTEALFTTGNAKLTEAEKEQKYPLFLQWDKRWGYEEYGDFNIALSGCGPTTLAMAAVALTGDIDVTPNKVAEYSMKNGYYAEGIGTAWSLMTEGCKNFNIQAEEIALDEFVMKKQLDAGKVIICSVRQGDFTAQGHFILIYDYDESGFRINDPNCIYRSSIGWKFEDLKSQIRVLWAFEKLEPVSFGI